MNAKKAEFISRLKTAISLVEEIHERFPPPDIGTNPDEDVFLEWFVTTKKVLSISIGKDNNLYWAARIDTDDPSGSHSYSPESGLPKVILEVLNRIYAKE